MLKNLRRKSLVKTYHEPIHQVHFFDQGHAIYLDSFSITQHKQRLSKEKMKNPFQKQKYFTIPIGFWGVVETLGEVEFNMIYCPKGTFTMGLKIEDENEDEDEDEDEDADQKNNNPPREETIEKPFLLGETEITQELYEKVIGKNPSGFKNPQNPVEKVSWEDAILFCNELSRLQGLDACYSTRKVKIGLLRGEIPSDKKELKQYNKLYDIIREQITEELIGRNPNNIEFEIEYDPDISTCDVVIANRVKDEVYSIEADWVEAMKGKYSFSWETSLTTFDEFLKNIQTPIFLCDFDKNGYRLPTEKEWEYAAKADTNNQWAGTDNIAELSEYAWEWRHKNSNPVKALKPNEWGFYDMAGNVWEWCWDKYDPKDPKLSSHRVCRGGCFNSGSSELRSAFRGSTSPSNRGGNVGFRVCRSLVN